MEEREKLFLWGLREKVHTAYKDFVTRGGYLNNF
jgi:hypothetical protein